MFTKRILIPACLVAFWLFPIFAGDDEKAGKPDTSKEIGYETFMEKNEHLALVVGTQLAGLSSKEHYLPFPIAVGATGEVQELAITLDSFMLTDAKGDMYTTATPDEVGGKHSLVRQVNEMTAAQPLATANLFGFSAPVESHFYTAEGVGDKTVHIARETYFRDTIYFPVPTGGLDGVLTLRIDVEGAEPVEVRFTVPEIGHKKDHDHSGHDHD